MAAVGDEGGIGGAAAGAFGFEGGVGYLVLDAILPGVAGTFGDHSGSGAPNQKSNDIQAT